MIAQSFIQELLSRIDIVEVINKVVPLKKTGKNYMCCCPFHKEKTPSFSVNPQKQLYKCFGCGASGSAIGFVMQYEGVSYPEAIRRLAESIGMTVPEEHNGAERRQKAKTLTDFMQHASDFYTQALKANQHVIDYLKRRGISGQTAARFGLGYSPDAWSALKEVFGADYDSEALTEQEGCGLVIVNEQGRRYDRFRGRLMFPIRNPRGQVIGFGARTLNGDEHPKYLNSPETAIYHKGREIYGLYEASAAIRDKGRAIVCEGYMDVIQLSQAGFEESCAALGTAVTVDHVRKLLKMVNCIYFSFDGDSAGQHALERALHAALPVVNDSQEVRFVVLPQEHDPDSLIRQNGAHAFEAELKNSLTLTQFFLRTVSSGKDLTVPEGRSQMLAQSKPLIVTMTQAPILREQLIGDLAMLARMSPDEVTRLFGLAVVPTVVQTGKRAWNRNQTNSFRRQGWESKNFRKELPIDQSALQDGCRGKLLQYLLSFPTLATEFSGRIEEEFVGRDDEMSRKVLEVWRSVTEQAQPITQGGILLELLHESPYIATYRAMLNREFDINTPIEVSRLDVDIILDTLEEEDCAESLKRLLQASEHDLAQYQRIQQRRLRIKKQIAEKRAQLSNWLHA